MDHQKNAQTLSQDIKKSQRLRIQGFFLVLPLLLFIVVFFIVPISLVLYRSFYAPALSELLPKTSQELNTWDGNALPDERVWRVFVEEFFDVTDRKEIEKLAILLNRQHDALGTLVKSTGYKLVTLNREAFHTASSAKEFLISLGTKEHSWANVDYWHAIRQGTQALTLGYYLSALDMTYTPKGDIALKAEKYQVYRKVFVQTLSMAAGITLLCVLLGYPLAYYLVHIPVKRRNVLFILILLPFWTPILARITSWIVLLQNKGVVNEVLRVLNVFDQDQSLELLYNDFSVVLVMVHILLPFMILPLYSVMQGIDASYVRASLSLGARPFYSFWKIYLPLSLSGVGTGSLLVFTIAIGYYITPALVGGASSQMISNQVAFHMQVTNNWELAAALASIVLVSIALVYLVYAQFMERKQRKVE